MRKFSLFFLFILLSCKKQDVNPYKEIESVTEYVVVPKTNPEYWTEPKGLMQISEDFYDKMGRKTKTVCRLCQNFSQSPSYDIVTNYYEGKDLVRIHKERRDDTIDVHIKYFKDQKIKIEYIKAKDSCVGLNYITINDSNDEIRRINLDFSYFNEVNGFRVGYSIFDNELKKNEKKCNFYRGQFALNKNALKEVVTADLNKLQIIQAAYYKKFMDYKDNYHDSEVVSFYKDGKLIREKTGFFGYYKNRVDSTLYFYNEKGLLIKKKVRYGVFDGEYRYIYKYRE